jgi:hypothetical protein
VSTQNLVQFVDEGGSLLLVADKHVSHEITEVSSFFLPLLFEQIGLEFGFEFGDAGMVVVDYHDHVSNDPTLTSTSDIINAHGLLSRKVGRVLSRGNS